MCRTLFKVGIVLTFGGCLIWFVSPPSGPFTKYKAYQVSLFTVSNSNNVHHLSSVIGYSLQGRKYQCLALDLELSF